MGAREKVNILLVDDQPAKLLSLETVLADLGENLIKASSADEALKHILTKEIAVLLVDVCMPKMDGFELAELVRQHPRFTRTAIIFISAVHLTDADRLRGYDLGAVDYIPVPIIPQVLRAKVAVFAELYRKTHELERLNAELQDRVAELDRSNERLRFADRMATIGTLAAGLGHDMGNLLLPVRMRLDTLEQSDLPGSAREDVVAIRTATEYLRRLAGSLRMLALDPQNMAINSASTNLAEWWTETEGMVRNGVPRTVTLSARIPQDLPPVRMDKAGLTQVVFNLVQNAGDALKPRPEGSVLVAAGASQANGTVWLSVTDDGPGMTEDAKRRCMEPFFTTKTRELGTGLGLALVVGLMKRAGGKLHIDSSPGKGACFKLELPIATSPQTIDGTRASRRGVAVVNLSDSRLFAHVRSVLDALEFDVRSGEHSGADVWVTEMTGHGTLQAVRSFVASRPACRALVFGGGEPIGDEGGRLVCIERAVKPSTLHTRISQALALSGKDGAA